MNKPPYKSAMWYAFLIVIFIAGALLVCFYPSALGFLARVSARIKPDACGRFVGIALMSMPISTSLIYWAMSGIRKLFDIDSGGDAINRWPQVILGTLENGLYVIALVMGKPDFIGFWIVVKTAGGWVRWSGLPKDTAANLNEARRRFYGFLVGNAFSAIAALVTFGLLKLFALNL